MRPAAPKRCQDLQNLLGGPGGWPRRGWALRVAGCHWNQVGVVPIKYSGHTWILGRIKILKSRIYYVVNISKSSKLALTWKSLDLKPIIVQWKTWKRPKLGKETSLSWRHSIFFSQRWWKEDTLYIDVKILEAPSQIMFAPQKKTPNTSSRHIFEWYWNWFSRETTLLCIRINFDKMWVWLGYCIWKRLKV